MAIKRRSFLSSATLGLASAAQASQTPFRASGLDVLACRILTFPEPKKSAEKIRSWIEKAASEEIDVVVFPEAAVCGYVCEPEYWKTANRADFEAAEETVISAGRRLNVAVVLGTAHWEDGRVFDSVLVIDRGVARKAASERVIVGTWLRQGPRLVEGDVS